MIFLGIRFGFQPDCIGLVFRSPGRFLIAEEFVPADHRKMKSIDINFYSGAPSLVKCDSGNRSEKIDSLRNDADLEDSIRGRKILEHEVQQRCPKSQ